MLRTNLLLGLVVLLSACGDDGVHHLADAPAAPTDAGPDAPDAKVPLNITVTGSGNGTVTSSPDGITCTTASCSADFDRETIVTLTAVPGTGSVFVGWMGACTGTVPTCDVTLANAANVTATFDVASYAVTVTKAGAGTGTVAGNGLDCGSTCTVMVDHGTMLSLTATPGNLSVFAGWGGACTGTAGCMVTVTGPTTISANFPLDTITLFVSKGGNGAGTVTATGISCGADCNETYTAGQMVTLTAAAATGSTFTGWSGGGCTGTATCTVTMTVATTVTATFTLQQFALTVAKAGSGSGNVTSNPAGIACGADCAETYNYNTMVVLTAAANATTSNFGGWSGGGCTGTGTCTVTMTQAFAVTATFTLKPMTLQVTKGGDGVGTVSGNGVSCGATCTVSVPYGTVVTLTAAAGSLDSNASTFIAWSGAGCTGTGACTFTITANTTVDAKFKMNPNFMFTSSVSYSGNLGGVAGADDKCKQLATASGLKGTYRAYISATGLNAPSRFAGASGWNLRDGTQLVNAIGEFGTIALAKPPLLDEAGSLIADANARPGAWTGTLANGTYEGRSCNSASSSADWSVADNLLRAESGRCDFTDSNVIAFGTPGCAVPMHLYCFGIDRRATVP